MIDWSAIQQLAQCNARLYTRRGEPFHVVAANETTVWIEPQTGWSYTIGRAHLEKAVNYLQSGGTLPGPGAYKRHISGDRPSYAWAMLRHLGYL